MGLTYTFRSDDAGAPTLAGTAGYLINVLDAVLVNGYNSQTVTITRSGTTATINKTGHGWRNGQILAVSGADQADYNITARCTRIDANNVSIQVANSPATPATGTITCKVAPLGWTKAYSGTNKAAYRQPTVGANGLYLRVDDNYTNNARVRGYEAMTDVDTGTGPFPTTVQIAAPGLYLYKSDSASTAARRWQIWSNGKIFYLVCSQFTSSFGKTAGAFYAFGDITSHKAADAYATVLIADTSGNYSGNSSTGGYLGGYYGAPLGGHYICREANQTALSAQIGKNDCIASSRTNSSRYLGSSGPGVYPDTIFGGIPMSRVFVSGEYAGIRGRFPGLWSPHNGDCFHSEDTFSGAAGTSIEGRSFELCLGLWSQYIPAVFETSDTWD